MAPTFRSSASRTRRRWTSACAPRAMSSASGAAIPSARLGPQAGGEVRPLQGGARERHGLRLRPRRPPADPRCRRHRLRGRVLLGLSCADHAQRDHFGCGALVGGSRDGRLSRTGRAPSPYPAPSLPPVPRLSQRRRARHAAIGIPSVEAQRVPLDRDEVQLDAPRRLGRRRRETRVESGGVTAGSAKASTRISSSTGPKISRSRTWSVVPPADCRNKGVVQVPISASEAVSAPAPSGRARKGRRRRGVAWRAPSAIGGRADPPGRDPDPDAISAGMPVSRTAKFVACIPLRKAAGPSSAPSSS